MKKIIISEAVNIREKSTFVESEVRARIDGVTFHT